MPVGVAEDSELILSSIGSRDAAWDVVRRMQAGSPAYAAALAAAIGAQGAPSAAGLSWEQLPVLTKSGFYGAHPWRELVPRDSFRDIYFVLRSSGTSGNDGKSRGFFWPQLRSLDAGAAATYASYLTELFRLDQRKTLAIVGLSLGSWAGGEQFSFTLKALALKAPYPLVVFNPGNQHQEILELIEKAHTEFDQILICVCPSAIFYLERLAAQSQAPLPLEKITFVVTGEPFPEAMRESLQRRAGNLSAVSILSVYGAADAGILGVESPPLVAMRQALGRHPELARELGFAAGAIPNLYHAHREGIYYEMVGEELVLTKWQGIPLVRYNLQDRARLLSWRALCARLSRQEPDRAPFWTQVAELPLTDVIAVWGRSQGCLFLCGSNIFESMLQEVLLRSSLRDRATGIFVAWTGAESGQQILNWQIELKNGATAPDAAEVEALHEEFVRLLSEQQPEFAEDYERFYRPAEKEGLRLFRFHFCSAPHLAQHERFIAATKRRIILDGGPI